MGILVFLDIFLGFSEMTRGFGNSLGPGVMEQTAQEIAGARNRQIPAVKRQLFQEGTGQRGDGCRAERLHRSRKRGRHFPVVEGNE